MSFSFSAFRGPPNHRYTHNFWESRKKEVCCTDLMLLESLGRGHVTSVGAKACAQLSSIQGKSSCLLVDSPRIAWSVSLKQHFFPRTESGWDALSMIIPHSVLLGSVGGGDQAKHSDQVHDCYCYLICASSTGESFWRLTLSPSF